MASEKRLTDIDSLLVEVTKLVADGGTSAETVGKIIIALTDAPTVDAVEVVHGRWKPHYETFDEDPSVGVLGGDYQTGWQCSVCGRYEPSKEPYCNCGAKMDGERKDNDSI